jgi:uncharacterized lipoprotein YmbA
MMMKRQILMVVGVLVMGFILTMSGCASSVNSNELVQPTNQPAEIIDDTLTVNGAETASQAVARIEGRVQNSFDCKVQDFAEHTVTVRAAMKQCSGTTEATATFFLLPGCTRSFGKLILWGALRPSIPAHFSG